MINARILKTSLNKMSKVVLKNTTTNSNAKSKDEITTQFYPFIITRLNLIYTHCWFIKNLINKSQQLNVCNRLILIPILTLILIYVGNQ